MFKNTIYYLRKFTIESPVVLGSIVFEERMKEYIKGREKNHSYNTTNAESEKYK